MDNLAWIKKSMLPPGMDKWFEKLCGGPHLHDFHYNSYSSVNSWAVAESGSNQQEWKQIIWMS